MAAFRDVDSGPVQVAGGGRAHPRSRGGIAGFLLAVVLVLSFFPPATSILPAGIVQRTPTHLKAFYFMTYFTLGLILAVLFIISLWRWC